MSTVKTKLGASFIALALTLAGVGTLATAGPAMAGSKKSAKHKKYNDKKKKKKKSSSKGQSMNQKAHNETNQNSKQEIDNETEQRNDVDQGGTQTQGDNRQLLNGLNVASGNNVCPNVSPTIVVGGIAVPVAVLAPATANPGNATSNPDPDNTCNANSAGGATSSTPSQSDDDASNPGNFDGADNNGAVNAPQDGADTATTNGINDNDETEVEVN